MSQLQLLDCSHSAPEGSSNNITLFYLAHDFVEFVVGFLVKIVDLVASPEGRAVYYVEVLVHLVVI